VTVSRASVALYEGTKAAFSMIGAVLVLSTLNPPLAPDWRLVLVASSALGLAYSSYLYYV